MKKKTIIKKNHKKEKNGLLKFVFLAGFIVLLGLSLLLPLSKEPQTGIIASETTSTPSPLRRAITHYLPKKAIQVGWFKIFRPSPTPTPTSPPPPTPTPCPGGTHTQSENKQSVAFAPGPGGGGGGGAPGGGPGMWLPPTAAPIIDPCISPQP